MLATEPIAKPAVLAIDVGYGYTKAISSLGKKIIFPSVIAPARELALEAFQGVNLRDTNVGHLVKIIRGTEGGPEEAYFVGDLALREGENVQHTLDRNKHEHPMHDVVLLTAAALCWDWPRRPALWSSGSVRPKLVVGLPAGDWSKGHEKLARHMAGLAGWVSVDGSEPVWISFNYPLVYPQGAAALLTAPDLPEDGVTALVDVGRKTTDCVAVKIENGVSTGLEKTMCGSVNLGASALEKAVAESFKNKTGTLLPHAQALEAMRTGYVWYRGERIELTGEIEKAKKQTARAIADEVFKLWGSRGEFVRKVYLAGGGAEALPLLRELFPAAQILPDAQWANARGFLKAGGA
ncbi:hypothetical protein GFC01_10920 [Desulfofundulus thermobenzoicus]|uniref:Uncharacterized protein n=1 Tax=Desulfofundulus thermobenzoicus TaxID=29376 RepID=A0A6N7IRS1_9FIRM|nr:ParM/StbA family protein [Desulfofundulus thermobenzoicus]MQL52764.1 hypothetical protein [Desulfofundulus thermobenzoicus]